MSQTVTRQGAKANHAGLRAWEQAHPAHRVLADGWTPVYGHVSTRQELDAYRDALRSDQFLFSRRRFPLPRP